MFKKILDYFDRNFFNKDLPFEYRLSSIFFMGAVILSLLSFSVNLMLGASQSGLIFQATIDVVLITVFFIPLKWKKKALPVLLLVVVFVYIPFMYFQYAGFDGSVLYFVALSVLILSFIYKGKIRIVLVALDVAIYVVAILLQASFPWLVTPMASPDARIPDLLTAVVFTLLGMYVLARYVKKAYESERLRNIYLLNELENKNSELEELSVRDALTGTFNRRYLTEVSDQILIRGSNEHKRACLIMLDIDLFKHINDTYGHAFGDEILKQVAKTAQEQLRKGDTFARYGGEEFLAVLYPETLENAVVIAERIRQAVSEIRQPDGSPVTVSLGVVESELGERVDSVFMRVDEQLYRAKNNGRNRVEVAPRRQVTHEMPVVDPTLSSI